MKSRLRYVVIDVFTDRPLAGNQLAVFTDARTIPEGQLQPLAREINFSETVYVYPAGDEADARLRIFTPSTELQFAGHPILGAAFVLGGPLQLPVIRLETGAGVIPVELEREGATIVSGRMCQPIPTISEFGAVEPLLHALGIDRSTLPIELYDNGMLHVFVALESPERVAELDPDFSALIRLTMDQDIPIAGTNCFAGNGSHWKTRMFAPADGVPEDPGTGSAAGSLALHLARHGEIAFGDEIEISQGAEIGRPSTLYARTTGAAERVKTVEVSGAAVVVARGEFGF